MPESPTPRAPPRRVDVYERPGWEARHPGSREELAVGHFGLRGGLRWVCLPHG
jgi:hypothetical protein